jgi:DNA-binding TFAR19-related protein (PDSD5 family)
VHILSSFSVIYERGKGKLPTCYQETEDPPKASQPNHFVVHAMSRKWGMFGARDQPTLTSNLQEKTSSMPVLLDAFLDLNALESLSTVYLILKTTSHDREIYQQLLHQLGQTQHNVKAVSCHQLQQEIYQLGKKAIRSSW